MSWVLRTRDLCFVVGLLASVASSTQAVNSKRSLAPVMFAPLGFELVEASGSEETAYVLRRKTSVTIVSRDGFTVQTCDGECVTYAFDGASSNRSLESWERAAGVLHSFVGNDPSHWRRDQAHFERVALRDLYPGIDLEFRSSRTGLEYDFVVHPGADSSRVSMRISGARTTEVDSEGRLLVAMDSGRFLPQRPYGFRLDASSLGISSPVAARFKRGSSGSIEIEFPDGGGEALGVFDPVVEYVSYLGGTMGFNAGSAGEFGLDEVWHLLPTADDQWIVVGVSTSTDFVVTPGSYQTSNQINAAYQVFVRRYEADGKTLVFSSKFGGVHSIVFPRGAALAANGEIVIAGGVSGPDLPATPGAIDPTFDNYSDGFVLRLSSDGSTLISSTYLGGSGSNDLAWALTLDAAGNSVVVGQTNSPDYPTTPNAFKPTYGGNLDAFVAVVNREATQLLYSTFFGGSSGADRGYAVAIDGNGAIHLGGDTNSQTDFPISAGAVQPFFKGQEDAFVAKLQPGGASLRYSTYLGGGGNEFVTDMQIDSKGQLCFVGEAQSGGLPTTPNSFDPTFGGQIDCFVGKLNVTGTALLYSGFLGGWDDDREPFLALDARDRAYVVGRSYSSNLPFSPDAFDTTKADIWEDAFVARIVADGSAVDYCTLIGGSAAGWQNGTPQMGIDAALGVGVRDDLMVMVGGRTSSADLPVTSDAEDSTFAWWDGFVARIDLCKGDFEIVAPGCPSPGIPVAPTLSGSGCPEPGLSIALRAEGLAPNAPFLLMLGVGGAEVPFKPGCRLAIAPLVSIVPAVSPMSGTWEVAFPIPSASTPGSVWLQLLSADPQVAGAAAASDSLRLTIGP